MSERDASGVLVGLSDRLLGPVATAAAAATSFAFVGVVDPNVAGRYPVCPSLTLFGVLCPFCGGLRATHALSHGDLQAMVSSNLLLPLIVVASVWAWLSWTSSRLGGRWSVRAVPWGPRIAATAGLIALAYGILRNLPWPPFTVLAP